MKSISAAAIIVSLLLAPLCANAEDTYEITAGSSYVTFEVLHFKVTNAQGRFNAFTGSVAVDGDDASSAKVELKIEAASVDTGNAKRDEHLIGPDFFNSKEFPEITFKSTGVNAVEGKENTYELTGNLTMLGQTKEVTADFVFMGTGKGPRGADIAGGEAQLTIKRSDFGMNYGLPDAIGDEVKIKVSIQGYKQ